jgi:hypothetical protein
VRELPPSVYGRFFDGPPPQANITAWEACGGFALVFAGGLSPGGDALANAGGWADAVLVNDDVSTLPSSLDVTGSAIAVFGTLGDTASQLGQASVFVDSVETWITLAPTRAG